MILWLNNMPVKFQKLKPNRIFQSVVEQIQEAILDGRLKPGDTLPSEMKLKAMFDASRGSIREALRVLEQKGLIEIRPGVGGGAVVKIPETYKITECLNLFIQSRKVTPDQLSEFRECVEGRIAALAAKRVGEKDKKRLQNLLSRAKRILSRKNCLWEDFIQMDIKIHIAIAEITQNPVFVAVVHMVHENILGTSGPFKMENKKILKENYNDLCLIVKAIEDGDCEKAKELAEKHIENFNRSMENIKKEKRKWTRKNT